MGNSRINKLLGVIFSSFFLLATSAQVRAEQKLPEPEFATKKNAISIQPLGAIWNSYFMSYERQIAGRHSMVFEGGYVGPYKFNLAVWGSGSSRSRSAWNIERGYTLALHYRFHFTPRLSSWFIGVFAKYGSQGGTILSTYNSGDMLPSNPPHPRIGFTATYKILGFNIGRRWIWDSGLTLAVRLGAGINFTDYNYSLPEYTAEKTTFRDIFSVLTSLDTEFSAGYAF
jgi:Protein of unknown function (DUF3575)